MLALVKAQAFSWLRDGGSATREAPATTVAGYLQPGAANLISIPKAHQNIIVQ